MKKINAIMGTEGGEFIREVAYVPATAVKKRLRTDLHSQEQSPAPLLRNFTTARANVASVVTATATAQRFAVMTQLRSLTRCGG